VTSLRISAVVPCFNGAAYLEEALSSIRMQTRPVDECIVVDDGSTDASADLAERCGATVIRHRVNRGEAVARNTGWRAATGDAIAWLDSDDCWRPHHLEVVGGLLERYPEAGCAFGAVQRFGLDDQLVLGLVPAGEPCELLEAAFTSWLHASIGCVMRRPALEEIGGYDERWRTSVDFDLWLRLARHNRFVATHEVTADWRWHEAQQSNAALRQIIAVHRYRRHFLATLRHDGDHELADGLEPLLRPAWDDHLEGVRRTLEQRARRACESRGATYRGPTLAQRAHWDLLRRMHPSAIEVLWRATGRLP
jgi:GT2 family glycosyltransferase